MPEFVARRLLAESGSWNRLQSELQTGTGLGHGLVPAERRALLDRFNATREQLARDVAGMFEGTVVVADTGVGRQIEVRFLGDKGAEHSTQAMHYLDAKSPGWQRQMDVALYAGSPELGARGTRAMRALERITPEGRHDGGPLRPAVRDLAHPRSRRQGSRPGPGHQRLQPASSGCRTSTPW